MEALHQAEVPEAVYRESIRCGAPVAERASSRNAPKMGYGLDRFVVASQRLGLLPVPDWVAMPLAIPGNDLSRSAAQAKAAYGYLRQIYGVAEEDVIWAGSVEQVLSLLISEASRLTMDL